MGRAGDRVEVIEYQMGLAGGTEEVLEQSDTA